MYKSLNEKEYAQFAPKAPAYAGAAVPAVPTAAGEYVMPEQDVLLDGTWDLIMDGNVDRVYEAWTRAIPCKVPGSIHTALVENKVIPDPIIGRNDVHAREKSTHKWWYRRTFKRPFGDAPTRLVFEGVCEECVVWLNGMLLGGHKGMFGGPEFDITDLLKDENDLRVMLKFAPTKTYNPKNGELYNYWWDKDTGWVDTAVFNCCYGWHYAKIPALGIWQSVKLVKIPEVEMVHPWASVQDLSGRVDLCMELEGPEGGFEGTIEAVIEQPGDREDLCFSIPVQSKSMHGKLHAEFTVPDPQLWWPNGLGEPNLYRAKLTFLLDGKAVDHKEFNFGIRTITTVPVEGQEPDENMYNWQFVVNGQKVFIKGANWCTLDFAMDFSYEKYERFLGMAKRQHLQMLRAWGAGMMETEEFYDLCDRYGIMVLQEFPTAWNSQKVQPPDVIRETLNRGIRRIRKHASLALWCGGNESESVLDAMIDMMGRMSYELDGTRVFHRNDPWGGSSHNYYVYWNQYDFDFNLSYQDPFIGEFGFASSPNKESVQKYLTEADFEQWPELEGGNVAYRTPVYNINKDMQILHRYIPEFLPDVSVDNMIVATQISQVITIRNTLELARSRFPQSTGILYYKLTDVWPAVSWSTVDYFGVPKMAYYFIQDSYEPLHACVLLKTFKPEGKAQELPVHLFDDANDLEGKKWTVNVRAYGADLTKRIDESWSGEGSVGHNKQLGVFNIDEKTAAELPLMVVVELLVDGKLHGRTFYWMNFKAKCGCLFELPKTTLKVEKEPGMAVITNTGDVPAVAVNFLCSKISDKFIAGDNFVWIEPGETLRIETNRDDYEGVTAWNA